MDSNNTEMHDCECGFRWRHGKSGAHDCGPQYRQTIRELRAAAAPQAVADERAAFEKAMNDLRFFPAELDFSRTPSPGGRDEYANKHLESCWNGWQARAAAPVQAQEPVAWKVGDDVFDTLTEAKLNVRNPELTPEPLYRALVRPVAVPDGWRDAALESAVQAVAERAGKWQTIAVINAFDAIRSLKKNRHALPESCSSFAAPAAQGDAKPFKWPNGCDSTIPKALRYLARNPRPSGGEDWYNGMHLLQLADEMEQAVKLAAIAAKAAS